METWYESIISNYYFLMDYFRIGLDFQNYCENSTDRSHITQTQFPLILMSYISMLHLSQ